MINPVNSTNAVYTAQDALKTASNRVDSAAKEIEQGNIQADKIAALEVAKENAKVQAVNLQNALKHQQNIIDIIVK